MGHGGPAHDTIPTPPGEHWHSDPPPPPPQTRDTKQDKHCTASALSATVGDNAPFGELNSPVAW